MLALPAGVAVDFTQAAGRTLCMRTLTEGCVCACVRVCVTAGHRGTACSVLQLKDEVVLLKAAVRTRDSNLAAVEETAAGLRADLLESRQQVREGFERHALHYEGPLKRALHLVSVQRQSAATDCSTAGLLELVRVCKMHLLQHAAQHWTRCFQQNKSALLLLLQVGVLRERIDELSEDLELARAAAAAAATSVAPTAADGGSNRGSVAGPAAAPPATGDDGSDRQQREQEEEAQRPGSPGRELSELELAPVRQVPLMADDTPLEALHAQVGLNQS